MTYTRQDHRVRDASQLLNCSVGSVHFEQAGLHCTHVGRYERGALRPLGCTIERLLDAFLTKKHLQALAR